MNKLVIHCSDTPNGREHNAEDIHRWHRERGWDGIGYHYVIKLNGEVETGRPHYWMGSHVKSHNMGALGICLIGRDEFTPEQMSALEGLVIPLTILYPNADVVGHCDLDRKKTCPNFDVKSWWVDVQKNQID